MDEMGINMRIDCDECAHQGTDQCRDCVVSFLLDREEGTVVVDAEEARAMRALGEAGLVPILRLSPRPPSPEAGEGPPGVAAGS